MYTGIKQPGIKARRRFSVQPDPALQYNAALRKAKQAAALSASLLSSWALTPASPGALSCQEPSLLPTYAREESSIPEGGGAGTQAGRNSLTFLHRLLGSISISSGSRLPPGPRRRSGTSASNIVGETEWGGWVGWERGECRAWEPLHKGLPNDFAPVMQGLLARGPGGCLLLACLLSSPPSRERRNIEPLPGRARKSYPSIQKSLACAKIYPHGDWQDPALGCRSPVQWGWVAYFLVSSLTD